MKCENCGKYEADYHYTSNINGNVTEKHLCSECARKLGYGSDMFYNTGSLIDDMFDGFFSTGRRSMTPFGTLGMTMPAMLIPQIYINMDGGIPIAAPSEEKNTAADPEMKKMREMNILKNQMKTAAENEDFEKAAEIRDKIKKLENENNEKPE